MAREPIRYHERVLIARHALAGPPLTGTAIARRATLRGDTIYTVVLDAPTTDGRCVLDAVGWQLVVLPVR